MTPSPPEARLRDLYRDYIKADVELEYETWLEVELRELQEALQQLLDYAEAMHGTEPVEAGVWFAARDAARKALGLAASSEEPS